MSYEIEILKNETTACVDHLICREFVDAVYSHPKGFLERSIARIVNNPQRVLKCF